MKRFWLQKWFIRLVSLLLAILIVVYIDSTRTGFITQGQPSRTRESATQTRTIKVPLQVSVNTDQYYVVGYPERVKVTLSGSNALVTSAINTQNFRAYIDLTHCKVGKHIVKVHLSGLNKEIARSVKPQTVQVDIERRKSRTMPVQIEYNKNAVANGYHFGKAKIDPAQVEVTGARSEIDRIDQIVARVTLPTNLHHTYQRQVILEALDSKKRQLNVVIQPTVAQVTLPISIAKKKVKLSLNSENESNNRVYSVTANQNEVWLYGEKAALRKIKRLHLKVNLRKINASTTMTYPLPLPKGVVQAQPSRVRIQIKVKSTGSIKQN